MPKPDLSYALGLTPVEAVQYFRSKGIAVTENWHDLWQEAHARAFTVAGVAKLDLLQDIRGAVAARQPVTSETDLPPKHAKRVHGGPLQTAA